MTRAATRSRRSSVTLEENRNHFDGNTQNLILSENPIINYQASDQTSAVPLANNYEQLPETEIYSQSSKQEHLISSNQSIFSDHIERVKHLHIGDTRIYQRTESAYEKIKTENRELETKIIITEKELTRKEQELKSEREKNDNLEKKLKIAQDSNTNLTIELTTTEKELTRRIKQELKSEKVKNNNLQSELKLTIEELKVTQDSNTNLTENLATIQKELKTAQVFNSDLQAKITTAENELKEFKIKIEALEKDVKILSKQRIKGEERKIALEKLSHGYRELQEILDKINQEKFIEETKKHKDILEKAEESLNDYEEC
ncbi:7586_t:CDS:2 [Gigaspora margarita]|uniref:7586_t:CDS:1 n=1 Tax=Gigaspora margarita TaxID=4874 RepID=A0ABN7WE53_GIGMA|nr:7586_t:CDS:2 [Gigaspora margarita]